MVPASRSSEGEALDAVRRCWLCGRFLGRKVEWHHPVPKIRGGREVGAAAPDLPRDDPRHFINAELARLVPLPSALLEREDVARFVKWVAGKPPDFHAPTRRR